MIFLALRWTNLTLAFVLELCALGALGYWGFWAGSGPLAKTALGIGVPLLAAVMWGIFAAPRAPVSAPLAGLVVQLAVFGSAAIALYVTGYRRLSRSGTILGILYAKDRSK